MVTSRRTRFASTFVRYWGANMQRFVWSLGHEWPGFSYDEEDRALLVRWGATIGGSFLTFTLTTVVLFMLLASAILAVVWGPVLMSDPTTVTAVAFFITLGAACILSITVGMPVSILGGALVASAFAPPFEPPAEDAERSLRVYRTVIGQIRLVGIVGGILIPIGSFLMLISSTFDRVIQTLGVTLPWIALGVIVVEGLLRVVPAPDS